MAKRVVAVVKLQITAGKATPAPPVGPALGQRGINIMQFCREFNERTASASGMVTPVEITVYQDKSFTFVTKTPPVAALLKKYTGLEIASGEPNKKKVAKISKAQIREIAQIKLPDLNTVSLEEAITMVEGTAKSMGIEVA